MKIFTNNPFMSSINATDITIKVQHTNNIKHEHTCTINDHGLCSAGIKLK